MSSPAVAPLQPAVAMPPVHAGKEMPSRIPMLSRLPIVAPLNGTTPRTARTSLISASPRPTTSKAAPATTSRPASRSVTTRPTTTASAVKPASTASPAASASPTATRPASRSVTRAPVSIAPTPAPAPSVSRPATRSASRSVASTSATATPRIQPAASSPTRPASRSVTSSSTTTTPRIQPLASPPTRPASRSVAGRPTTATAPVRASAPSTRATNSPHLKSNKAATVTLSKAASPLKLPAAVDSAATAPAPLSLPPPAAESPQPSVAVSSLPEAAQTAPAVTLDPAPADEPPLTDSSVPIYHAPHYKQEVHHARVRTRSSVTQPLDAKVFASTAEQMEAKLAEWRAEYLAMSVEEVADWLQRVLGNKPLTDYIPSVGRRESLEKETKEATHRASLTLSHPLLPPPSPLFDALQTGVLLCQLALAIDASLKLRYKQSAAVGSFFARDNINSFLDVALGWGVLRSQLFEVDDLVMRKHDRTVVNSLLDITRVVYIRFPHVLPPQLVQFELEIAALETQPPPPPPPAAVQPPPPPEPVAVEPAEPAEPPKPKGPRWLPYIPDEADPLDVAVGRIVNGHALDTLVKRVLKGQYYIAEEKVHHLRLVRHLVLVRVGGGWEGFLPMTSRKIMEGVGEANAGSDGVIAHSS